MRKRKGEGRRMEREIEVNGKGEVVDEEQV